MRCVPPPGAQPQPLLFVFHLLGMKIKALFTMMLFLNNLKWTISIKYNLWASYSEKGLINKSLSG